MCLVTSSIYECDQFSIGGIQKIYITNNEWIDQLNYGNLDLYNSIVYSIVPASPYTALTVYQYSVIPGATNYDFEKVESPNGDYYNHRFAIQFNYMSPTKRNTLHELVESKNLTLLFKDFNGNWWITGCDVKGGRITEFRGQTGTIDDGNFYSAVISLSSTYTAKYLSTSCVQSLNVI